MHDSALLCHKMSTDDPDDAGKPVATDRRTFNPVTEHWVLASERGTCKSVGHENDRGAYWTVIGLTARDFVEHREISVALVAPGVPRFQFFV